MDLMEFIIIGFVAIVIGSLFFFIFKTAGPWSSFWIFILILILAGWAAAAWIRPVGPVYWSISWGPVLFVILLFALFLAALTPTRREKEIIEKEKIPGTQPGDAAMFTLSFFFWAFIVFLLAAVIGGIIA
jgi:hypothetical protein